MSLAAFARTPIPPNLRKLNSLLPMLLLSLISVAAVVQLWHASVLLDFGDRMSGYRQKNLFSAGVVVLLGSWAFLAFIKRQGASRALPREFLTCLLFPAYASLTMIGRELDNWPLAVMYFLWSSYTFLFLPTLLSNERLFRSAIYSAWVILASSILAGVVYGIATNQLYWMWTPRISFVFGVASYGLALATLASVAVFVRLLAKGRTVRLLGTLTLIACLALAFAARARSAIVFIVVMLLVMRLARARQWGAKALAFGLVLLAATLLIASEYGVTRDSVDTLSSGRLSLYEYEMQRHIEGRGLYEWLFGTETFIGDRRTLVIDEASVGRFQRNLTDNSYLSLLLSHGLAGLLLFVYPFAAVARLLYKRSRHLTGTPRRAAEASIAIIVALAGMSVTVVTVPSLGNALALVLPVVLAPVYMVLRLYGVRSVQPRHALRQSPQPQRAPVPATSPRTMPAR